MYRNVAFVTKARHKIWVEITVRCRFQYYGYCSSSRLKYTIITVITYLNSKVDVVTVREL
jgi:hypothetical protein